MDELRELVALAVPPGSRVLAVDPDPELLKRLSARDCRTRAVLADLDGPDGADAFPGGDFDAVVLMGTLASVAFPAELLQRVAKLLTAEGRVVASVPNATSVARRLRAWQGLAQDEEVSPGRLLRRAFTGERIEQLLGENGLSTVETLRVRAGSVPPSDLPPAVVSFLNGDEDAGTDHFVIVASPTAGSGDEPVSLAEEMQRRLHSAADELVRRSEEFAALEHELEALQVDLALKDDFALEVRGQVQTVEARATQLESELDAARHQLAEQEIELADLRRQTGRGVLSLLVDRLLGEARRSG